MTQDAHYSVLLAESIEAVVTDPNGCYVDGTFGRGGHTRALLSALGPDATVIGIDKDIDAVEVGNTLAQEDARFEMFHGSFADMNTALSGKKATGILVDLGVSSPQLDQAERGFSFMQDGPLDMRMDNTKGMSAADWVSHAKEEDIANVIWEFGEERFSRRMAKAVVEARQKKPITRTLEFAEIIKQANPNWERHKHPATRAFQGVRIFINNELGDLKALLDNALDVLDSHGRLAVISFHSLEDRMVKRFFKEQTRGKVFPKGMPITENMREQTLKLVGKKCKATRAELEENIRSRSAVLRVAEKLT